MTETKRKGSQTLWYPRYPGDYQRKTSHLSLTEHGVYAVLLDHYYATGKPLPASAEQLQRICRAFEPHEVEAMHKIVASFFVRQKDGYHNNRADEELSKREEISEKRRIAANERYGKPKEPSKKARSKRGAIAPANARTATSTDNPESSDEDSLFEPPRNMTASEQATEDEMRAIHAAGKGVTRSEAMFSAWWEQFPRQRRGSKPSALKSWKRHVASGVDPQSILDGLASYLTSKDVAEGFACAGDVWLNKERWNDQPVQAGSINARIQPQRSRPMDGWLAAIEESAQQDAEHGGSGEASFPLLHPRS